MRIVVAIFIFLPGISACTIDDDNRCGKGRIYQNETCVEVNSEPDSDNEDDGGHNLADGGDTSGGEGSVTGLGEPCDSSDNCASFFADYCAKDPTKPNVKGVCSIADCTVEPNSCPPSTGLLCCDFPAVANTPNLCIPPAQKQDLLDNYGFDCGG